MSLFTFLFVAGITFANDLADLESRLLNLELQVQLMDDPDFSDDYSPSEDLVGSTPAGNLPVQQGGYDLPGFDCGNGETSSGGVKIYFPKQLDSTYPIVSFMHGSGGGRLDDLCNSIASLGIVVVTVNGGVCGDWTKQQIHAVEGSKANKNLHPALQHVDFSSVGVIGHSEGAAFTTGTAGSDWGRKNLKAAVMSHGASPKAAANFAPQFPSMFVTGSKDSRKRNHKIWLAFKAAPPPTLFVNVEGATHMAPAHSGPMNAMNAHFLGCYLIPRQESCDKIFSGGPDSVCNFRPMNWCEIRKTEEQVYQLPVPALTGGKYDINKDSYLHSNGSFDGFVGGSTPAGNYSVSEGGYSLPGFDCGDGTTDSGYIRIYFPQDLSETYPIVSFLHGSGGGVFGDLCYNIASLGIVVVAVNKGTCGRWSSQQIHAVLGSQQNQNLHPALSHVNYDSIGVIGHSEGGAYTMETSTWAGKYAIKAAVASHGVSQPAAPEIPKGLPIMFLGGSSDPKTHKFFWAYQDTVARPKIFADPWGENHMAPLHGSPMNTMMAHFLGCYTIPNRASCDIIYGDAPESLCKANPMKSCLIERT